MFLLKNFAVLSILSILIRFLSKGRIYRRSFGTRPVLFRSSVFRFDRQVSVVFAGSRHGGASHCPCSGLSCWWGEIFFVVSP